MSCHEVQEALLEGTASPELAEHLARCASCAAYARLLSALESLGAPLEAPQLPDLERFPHPSWLFRLPATFAPLGAGLGFLACGAWLLRGGGGWPAGGELQLLGQALLESAGYGFGEAVARAAVVFARGVGWQGALAALLLLLGSLATLRWAVGRSA